MKQAPLRRASLLALAGIAACGGPSPQPPLARPGSAATVPAAVSAPPPAAAGPSPLVSMTAPDRMPDTIAIDGEPSEWGSLVPPPPPAPRYSPRSTRPAPPPPPDPNPRGAPSRVSVALTRDGAYIAADLAEASSNGIWLGLRFPAPELPPIGHMRRDGGMDPLVCEPDPGGGEPMTPPMMKECQQLVDRYEAFVAAHEARFRRFFRIDRGGIKAVGEGSALEPIVGARAAFKATSRGMTVEALVPPSGLPRAAEAPIEGMAAYAIAATSAAPPAPAEERWVDVSAPEPVAFQPHADLRKAAYESARTALMPIAFSYHPGSPYEFEIVRYGASGSLSVEPRTQLIYSPEMQSGNVEVSYVVTAGTWVAVLKDGKLNETVQLSGAPMGSVLRGKEIHLFSYDEAFREDVGFGTQAGWQVLIVGPDGKAREGISHEFHMSSAWHSVSELHTPNFDTIGMRGVPVLLGLEENTSGKAVEVRWRFDRRQGVYVPTNKALVIPIAR
ncbi:hypothetical protein [Sorangium sp. So ce1182]|uniref:hypothetical protein n=1 Tax=Sorangium sp. So ce1182 TaxID=3133334 RepID=UPI003F621966